MSRAVAAVIGLLIAGIGPANAHEMRPSLLELRAGHEGLVEVTWKVALLKGRVPALRLTLPNDCEPVSERIIDRTATAQTARWWTRCPAQGLVGQVVRVDGLRTVGTEVFARHRAADGTLTEGVLRAGDPTWTVPGRSGPSTAGYFGLGLEHIWSGPDHLLFVFGLLLVVGRSRRGLLATISAFTLGHTVTLGAATLGWVTAPTGAVEAIIALSILYLAVEVGQNTDAPKYDIGRPWMYALVCGLVHGLGFAGALDAVGLPAGGVVGALLFFNLGVEAGQLAFIGVVLALARSFTSLPKFNHQARHVAAYGLGLPAGFWFVDRVASIISGV